MLSPLPMEGMSREVGSAATAVGDQESPNSWGDGRLECSWNVHKVAYVRSEVLQSGKVLTFTSEPKKLNGASNLTQVASCLCHCNVPFVRLPMKRSWKL